MKVIDLLVKIANEEEMPIIKHDGKYGKYDKEEECYKFYNDIKCTSYFGAWFNWRLSAEGLNDEVKIIENKPKKIDLFEFGVIEDTGHYELKKRCNEIAKVINELLEKSD